MHVSLERAAIKEDIKSFFTPPIWIDKQTLDKIYDGDNFGIDYPLITLSKPFTSESVMLPARKVRGENVPGPVDNKPRNKKAEPGFRHKKGNVNFQPFSTLALWHFHVQNVSLLRSCI